MRSLIFAACLLVVAVIGFQALISGSLAAARNAKSATFAERFAPALAIPAGSLHASDLARPQ
jgi:hypothetical protein